MDLWMTLELHKTPERTRAQFAGSREAEPAQTPAPENRPPRKRSPRLARASQR
ncbi:hypothetical protein [Calidithermus chliarophilus]|uniref:hypothetical protein n=1 Tax=Calidithermus chliarophilus TaxID=52023 RepID=UPI00040673D9|nr:hypothetical protein [Calidithermus chliarophilus]